MSDTAGPTIPYRIPDHLVPCESRAGLARFAEVCGKGCDAGCIKCDSLDVTVCRDSRRHHMPVLFLRCNTCGYWLAALRECDVVSRIGFLPGVDWLESDDE